MENIKGIDHKIRQIHGLVVPFSLQFIGVPGQKSCSIPIVLTNRTCLKCGLEIPGSGL